MNKEKAENFELDVRRALNQSVKELDDEILSRLRSARVEAIDTLETDSSFRHWWMAGSAVVAATVVLASISLNIFQAELLPADSEWFAEKVVDVDLLVAQEELELYEDLEFLIWLDESSYENG